MKNYAAINESLEYMEAFLADHASEPHPLTVALVADERKPDWELSLGSLRDIATTLREYMNLIQKEHST